MKTDNDTNREPLAIPRWLDRGANWSWRLILMATFAFLLLRTISYVRIAVIPALIALIIASAVRPATTRLCRAGLPEILASAIPLLIVPAVFVAGTWFVTEQTAAELERSDLQTQQVRTEIENWLLDSPFDLTRDQIVEAEQSLQDALIGGTRAWGANRGGTLISILGGAILTFVLTFLFIKDGPQMWDWAVKRVAVERRTRVDDAGRAASVTMAAYARSVVLTGLADASLIGIGLLVLGVPLILPLMVVTFLSAMLPIVGAVVAGLAATAVALITVGPTTALWVIGLTLVVQQVEGNIVMPMLIGRRVAIHPAVVLMALSAGGAIAGLAGAFLAVPIVAGLTSGVAAFGSVDTPQPTD